MSLAHYSAGMDGFGKDAQWKADNLPPGFGTTAGHTFSEKVTSTLRDLARHARSAILSKTSFSANQKIEAIPTLGNILIRLDAIRNGHVPRGLDNPRLLASILLHVRMKHAFLRLQGIHFLVKPNEYPPKKKCWEMIDRTMLELAAEDARYRYAYHILVLDTDIRFFNGVNTIEDIKTLPDFRMPTSAKVIEKVDELVLAHGPVLTPDETLFVVQVD
ncbi:hypothetical protein CROQUDRAFT_88094 [Cronartium quercuum f. sp. fusiforme G11]|uniref:Uncharacterized protein n=1 Tax=Cronartium quercuum f. sp. fusiforme G11 TaxID=708437 RepID=A0A9P6TG19_9BASI|nr:hypothetical protein CROQUDRAFT_88094 [Cronartium quercuum f. sp. fusiforme G11]